MNEFQVGRRGAVVSSILAAGVLAVTVVQAVPAVAAGSRSPSPSRHTASPRPTSVGNPAERGRAFEEARVIAAKFKDRPRYNWLPEDDGWEEAGWNPQRGTSDTVRRLAALGPGQTLLAIGAQSVSAETGTAKVFTVSLDESGQARFESVDFPGTKHLESYLRGRALGYQHIFLKTGAGRPHAQRLLNSFDPRATRQAKVFDYLSRRPGKYLDPARIGIGARLVDGTAKEDVARSAAANVSRELFKRNLIHKRGGKYAGKTEEELSGISLTRGDASTVDDYQLGPHAQQLMNNFHGLAKKRKEVFAFLSANPDTSFTLNELVDKVGGTSILEAVDKAANALAEIHAVKKLPASKYAPIRYQGKTEEELASMLTSASGN